MSSVIKELRKQLKKAKKELACSAQKWLDEQSVLLETCSATDWLDALNASSSEDMQNTLQVVGFPLVRCVFLDTDASFSTHLPQYSYQVSSTGESNELSLLAIITTLMEQLHQLDELLKPVEMPKRFKALDLARSMVQSVNGEWCYVEKGRGTYDYYSDRLATAREQFQKACQSHDLLLAQLNGQLDVRYQHCVLTLNYLVELLCMHYSRIPDQRFIMIRWLADYSSWQRMMINLALSVFGSSDFIHQNPVPLNIRESVCAGIINSLNCEWKQPVVELENQLIKKYTLISEGICAFENKLKAMHSELESQEILMSRRETAPLLLPTKLLSLHRFSQGFFRLHSSSLYQIEVQEPVTSLRLLDNRSTYSSG